MVTAIMKRTAVFVKSRRVIEYSFGQPPDAERKICGIVFANSSHDSLLRQRAIYW
jgi:hypothetical protein